MCACVRPCVRDVFAIYDDNILPRLIMIIFKIIILYFIRIRHTDDFPQRVYRLVHVMLKIPCLMRYLLPGSLFTFRHLLFGYLLGSCRDFQLEKLTLIRYATTKQW